MASFNINHYLIDETISAERFAVITPGSFKIKVQSDQGSISFIYVRKTNMIQPIDSPCAPFRVVPDDLETFLWSMRQLPSAKIYVETPLLFEGIEPVLKVPRIDWSRTIDVLVEHNVVTTSPSESFMCTDPRRFSFRDGSDDHSNQWWEVDCLGTGMCADITEKVVDEWSRVAT
jgi:hypothetical protein